MFNVVKIVSRCVSQNVSVWCLVTLLLSQLGLSQCEEYMHHFAVHIKGGEDAAHRVARSTGLVNIGQLGSLTDHYLFKIPGRERRSAFRSLEHHQRLGDHPEVHWHMQQVVTKRVKRDFQQPKDNDMHFTDPNYNDQWYLHSGAYGNFDMNVIPAWKKGYTGKNIVITILDDGIERTHTDLKVNYDPYASYDVNSHDNDPMPRYDPTNENRHGTRCAGEVSATANNTKCGVGIAYNSRIGGVRMLDGEVYDAVEATSLSFNRSHIDIYSASWGPDDDGRVVDGPGPLAKKAFTEGIKLGRGGKGSIYVWASGNGGSAQDSCNCDGYTNSIFTLSISSTSEKGTKPWYLEECSSTLATTYSSGAYNEKQITTDDLHDRCTSSHTGTSASAPLAAGIVALALEAKPSLTWRDVQYITLLAARPEPFIDGQWVTNSLGRKVSLRYGYGLMDGAKMVELAEQWTNVPEQHACTIHSAIQNEPLTGSKKTLPISTDGCAGTDREIKYLEHVQAQITLNYQRRGDVIIHLTSPRGTRSTLLPRRPNDVMAGNFNNWPFLSVHFWGEDPQGEWTLEIEDANEYHRMGGGKLVSWALVLYGTATQPVNLHAPGVTETPKPATTPSKIPITTVLPTNATGAYVCDKQCADGCTGPKPSECNACSNFRITATGECVYGCPSTGFYKQLKECRSCDKSCDTCSGPLMSECLTCPEGGALIVDQHVCLEECLDHYFRVDGTCVHCSKMCRTCEDHSNHCTSCYADKQLTDGKCLAPGEKPTGPAWMPESIRGVVVVLVIMCVFLLVFILAVLGLMYARNNQLLCWSYRYDKLPCGDKEPMMVLTGEDLENEDDLYP